MTKFMRQWLLCDNAKDVTELEEFDYDGYECYFESYPIYVTKFFYIIENLHYKNSLLRKKLHEIKQCNHSLRKKLKVRDKLFDAYLCNNFFNRYSKELLEQDLELCCEARGYLRCLMLIAEGSQLDRIYDLYDSLNSYILAKKI